MKLFYGLVRNASSLEISDKRALTRIYVEKVVEGLWLRKTNKELGVQYGKPSITGIARAHIVRWLRCVPRMEEEKTTK